MLVMQLPNYSVYTKLYCVVSVNETRNSGRTFFHTQTDVRTAGDTSESPRRGQQLQRHGETGFYNWGS